MLEIFSFWQKKNFPGQNRIRMIPFCPGKGFSEIQLLFSGAGKAGNPAIHSIPAYMDFRSAISAIFASLSLVSPCTRLYERYPFIRSILVRLREPHTGHTSISSS